MPLKHILLALLVVAIWGFNFVVIKLSVDALPPFLAASLRFGLAAFPAIIFVKKPDVPWGTLIVFGLSVGVALYAFLNLALFFGMPAGLASVVLQVQAFFTILFAFFVLKERPKKKQIIGGAIAFGGIGIIALQRLEGAGILAFVLTIFAAISWGMANVISRKAGKIEPFGFIVWSAAIASVPLLALSLII
jgi:O-acetylserine/cysteine efflux transporter